MTVKDKTIQDLRRENEGLREELSMIVECCRLCRFCEYLDADCTPTEYECKPKWRGLP